MAPKPFYMPLWLKVMNALHSEKCTFNFTDNFKKSKDALAYPSVLYFINLSHIHFIYDPHTRPCRTDIIIISLIFIGNEVQSSDLPNVTY